jgi:hypothetical protein
MKPSPWKRPNLPVHRPDRSPGGLYRSADQDRSGTTLAGVPMQTVSDAVVATVKLGYKVADSQIARGRRMGRQLRGAAQRAGVDDPNVVIDNAERLLLNALGTGLEWVEGAAAGEASPLRRLLKAEYRWLGRWLGLLAAAEGKTPDAAKAAATAAPAGPGAAAAASRAEASPAPRRAAGGLRIRHLAPEPGRRDVRVLRAELDGPPPDPCTVYFHHQGSPRQEPLQGTYSRHPGCDELGLDTRGELAPGIWRAAVCAPDGVQIGTLEIEL